MKTQQELEKTAETLVRNEVHCCLSGIVSALCSSEAARSGSDLGALCDQACDLAAPIDDYVEAASEHGAKITHREDGWIVLDQNDVPELWNSVYESEELAAVAYCDAHNVDPHQVDVYEHWAVSQRLGEDLAELGEKVDFDFAGLVVWARTTTGQMISMDAIMVDVARLLEKRISEL